MAVAYFSFRKKQAFEDRFRLNCGPLEQLHAKIQFDLYLADGGGNA